MKVPTYQKYGLKKSQVEMRDSKDIKVSHMLSHTLPLYIGIGLGLLVYVFYYIKVQPTSVFQIITELFLFATVGVICVGLPVIIFKLSEKLYYKVLNTHSDNYINIREYKNSRDSFEFWKIRMDSVFWNHLDGLSIENEIINLFKYEGYKEIKDESTLLNRYDHILSREAQNYYFAFRTNKVYDDINEINKLLENNIKIGAIELIIVAPKGVTKEVTEYLQDKPAKYLSVKGIIALIRTIKK